MKTLQALKFSLRVIFHPFDGFWDLKNEKRGNLKSSLILLVMTTIIFVANIQMTGFLFNYNNVNEINLFANISMVLCLFILWCTSNWCLTSLMDGKGNFRDIVIATSYSLTPYILLSIIMLAVSHFFTLDEGAFYYTLQTVAQLWTGFLLFFGTLVTHQYSLGKTFITVILIIVGMIIMVFIGLLFFNVIQQVISFFSILYREITLRT
ncbi:hypothetical protein HNQ56_001391 [Anaerotaenia torta]|uniref:Yip1 family protein n=1 Tax=Anaerotaenia torta TaxID=433293 RepID=UPI003D260A2A